MTDISAMGPKEAYCKRWHSGWVRPLAAKWLKRWTTDPGVPGSSPTIATSGENTYRLHLILQRGCKVVGPGGRGLNRLLPTPGQKKDLELISTMKEDPTSAPLNVPQIHKNFLYDKHIHFIEKTT